MPGLRFSTIFITVLFILTSCAGGGTAGSGGVEIDGRISDSSGAPLSNIQVVVKDMEGVERAATASDADGRFRLPELEIDAGTVTADLPGEEDPIVSFDPDSLQTTVTIEIVRQPQGPPKAQVSYGTKVVPTKSPERKPDSDPPNSSSSSSATAVETDDDEKGRNPGDEKPRDPGDQKEDKDKDKEKDKDSADSTDDDKKNKDDDTTGSKGNGSGQGNSGKNDSVKG